ncbi:hypothetical protein JCM24511_08897 [Saitozyma sp. JCM 24511]|nr:hypothetical protein JCM24511_08897 [Saitozyma sp. JCM 24511]
MYIITSYVMAARPAYVLFGVVAWAQAFAWVSARSKCVPGVSLQSMLPETANRLVSGELDLARTRE